LPPSTSDPSSDRAYAHTAPEAGGEWQSLDDHLQGVAARAAGFADAFHAAEWARLAGLWHDIGKYSSAFQRYLREAVVPEVHESDLTRTDHSTAGAQLAVRELGPLGHILAYPIAGHHSGLLDSISSSAGCMEARLDKQVANWESSAPGELSSAQEPSIPPALLGGLQDKDGFRVAFFVRMLFSCLVDADFLDTGAFMDPDRERSRPQWPDDTLVRLKAALHKRLARFGPAVTEVDRRRAEVLAACIASARKKPGFFSLTVPTGGGKTLSSLAFALEHAIEHGLDRVIYVAPFTSIIEQNAGVFREALAGALGAQFDPVVEHHSSLDPEKETTRSRLASENWDAPIVVTTSVQFYESLFTNRTSRCRKLHNLANAVVILDEAQCLPVGFLAPCLRALEELTNGYGSSVVLCTATQPAVGRTDDFAIGIDLERDREIAPDPGALYEGLKRVRVIREGRLGDEQLADRLKEHDQVLCILNTRRHARIVYELLRDRETTFHLSASMCAEHRAEVLQTIQVRLAEQRPCRVVSTQVVEAGVDIDFPVVFRAMAGLDSLARSAGRCNRHGRLDSGRVIVFETEHTRSEAFLADTAGSARQVLALHADPLSLEAVEHYFRLYYWEQSSRWDNRGILGRFKLDGGNRRLPFLLDFASVARDFRIIDDTGVTIIVPWGERGRGFVQELRDAWPAPRREHLRNLQRFTVQIPRGVWHRMGERVAEVVHGQYPVLSFPEHHYSSEVGLRLDGEIGADLIF